MAAPFFFISHHFSMFSPVDKYTGHKKNARWNLDQLDSYPSLRAQLSALKLNQSPKGNMWSAIPVALLCLAVFE